MPEKLEILPGMQCLVPHMKNLYWCGYYGLDKRYHSMRSVFLLSIYEYFMTIISVVHIVLEIIFIFTVRDDLGKVIDCSFIFLTRIDALAKKLVFQRHADRIRALLDIMNGPHFNYDEPLYQSMLLGMAATVKKVLRYFNVAAILTCTLWTIVQLADLYFGRAVQLTLWLPDCFLNSAGMVEIVIIVTQFLTAHLGVANMTIDAIVGTFMAQSKVQITILRHRLEHIVDHVIKDLNGNTNKPYSVYADDLKNNRVFQRALMNKFITCLESYKLITEFSEEVQSLFNFAVFLQFNISGCIICTTAYKLTDLNVMSISFASMCLYMMCILVQLFVYCYYGNELTYESNLLGEAAYNSEWLKANPEFQSALIIYMERTKRSIRPSCGGFIPLSLEVYVKILKSSYSFYAVLRCTK